jgi:hypothetical protein
MAIILKANKVNLFVSSVLFVFWYHSPNFLDTPCDDDDDDDDAQCPFCHFPRYESCTAQKACIQQVIP